MSFTFAWPRFSDQFHADAIQMLNHALNKGSKPPIIADKIEVVELEMGSQPPELEIRDIGELTMDQFRGIFRLSYSGDAHLVLKTKVQANPLNHKQPDIHLMAGSRGMLAAKHPLVVPMLLRLSHFRLNSYVVLVVSKQKGITLVFKTDPLQNVDINSTFDSIAVIQKFIQREIEGQLRQMFREDLPGIIHRLSQQWVKAKVEAPYLSNRHPPVRRKTFDTMSVPDVPYTPPRMTSVGLQPRSRPASVASFNPSRPLPSSHPSMASASVRSFALYKPPRRSYTHPVPSEPTTFPDIENFDPTYGLRPDDVPSKSLFSNFSRLFAPSKGLADLTEEPDENDEPEEAGSFDIVEWEDTMLDVTSSPTVSERGDYMEYESIPAVGGGTITRPRVLHAQSQIQATPDGRPVVPARVNQRPGFSSRSSTNSLPFPPSGSILTGVRIPGVDLSSRPSSSYFSVDAPLYGHVPPSGNFRMRTAAFPLYRARSETAIHLGQGLPPRPVTPESLETQPSGSSSGLTNSITTPPSSDPPFIEDDLLYMKRPTHERRLSTSLQSDSFYSGSPPRNNDSDPVILRPSFNNTIHQISTLSHSNHTLSPFTRSLQHFTVRSVPRRGTLSSGVSPVTEKQPTKARRKRTYHIGGRSQQPVPSESAPPSHQFPTPPSEFDASDMDLYFRSRDDSNRQHSQDIPSSEQVLHHDSRGSRHSYA